MYSPRISEDLIPVLYRKAKERKIPMTVLVDEILRRALTKDEIMENIKQRLEDLRVNIDKTVSVAKTKPTDEEITKHLRKQGSAVDSDFVLAKL